MQCPRGLEKEYRSRVTKTKTKTKTTNRMAKSGGESVKKKTFKQDGKKRAQVLSDILTAGQRRLEEDK